MVEIKVCEPVIIVLVNLELLQTSILHGERAVYVSVVI